MSKPLLLLLAAAPLAWTLHWLWHRILLSRAKHGSLAGHSRWSRRLARWLPYYEFDLETFFAADRATATIQEARRLAFDRLSIRSRDRSPTSHELLKRLSASVSDMEFTSRYRVPYPFSRVVREHLATPAFWVASGNHQLTDVDGHTFEDLGGSYGVNLFGYDFYRRCIDGGTARVRDLGPVLGFTHPVIVENVERLQRLSGHDSISFHMSGTEAVMQAVRLARYHTRRPKIVRFCGAYHGWWDDVQPGVGTPVDVPGTLTLADTAERALAVLRHRRDIACVLVNPLQALHPNISAPSDNALIGSRVAPGVNREAFGRWLQELRAVCTERGIILIFDEVFVGFRIARGGAQEYFGVRADLVTYGKSLGGGFPVGVVCGPRNLMQRYREHKPADICFARGTFNGHPYVLGAMAEFLKFVDSDAARQIYAGLDARWDARALAVNESLEKENLPVRVTHFSSIWTVNYLVPSRYNWMLQYYLRDQGFAVSWVGSGRFVFPINLSDTAFSAIADRIVQATREMQTDGWFWHPQDAGARNLQRMMLREVFHACLRWPWFGSISSPRNKAAGAL